MVTSFLVYDPNLNRAIGVPLMGASSIVLPGPSGSLRPGQEAAVKCRIQLR
jgi:hypothetical protein